MRFCALLAATVSLFMVMFLAVGCDNPPRPDEAAAYDKDLDGDPSVHTLVEVAVIRITEERAGPNKQAKAEDKSETTEPPAETAPAVKTPKKPAPASPSGNKAPRQALHEMARSVNAGNRAAFMECVYFRKNQKPFVSGFFELTQAMNQFKAKMEKTHGPDAVKGSRLSGLAPSIKEIDSVKIRVTGDSALATTPGQAKPIRLVKKNGKWLIDLSSDFPAGKDAAKVNARIKGMKGAVAKVSQKIGKPGYTAKKINKELEGAVMGAMMAEGLGDALKNIDKKVGK